MNRNDQEIDGALDRGNESPIDQDLGRRKPGMRDLGIAGRVALDAEIDPLQSDPIKGKRWLPVQGLGHVIR
jgi:hypothetical protein